METDKEFKAAFAEEYRQLSQRELINKLRNFMVEEFGRPNELSESQQDKWFEREGFANHFINSLFERQ
jgi:hypothetical protein